MIFAVLSKSDKEKLKEDRRRHRTLHDLSSHTTARESIYRFLKLFLPYIVYSHANRPLSFSYKKFINRGSTEFMCKGCLADDLNVPEELIDKKIEYFKKQGCTLFL